MARPLDWDDVARRKEQASRFLRDVKGDPERAAEIEAESLRSYAERRGFVVANPRRGGKKTMAKKLREQMSEAKAEISDLEEELEALQEENEQLDDQLNDVWNVLAPPDEGDEEEGDEDEDEDGDDDE